MNCWLRYFYTYVSILFAVCTFCILPTYSLWFLRGILPTEIGNLEIGGTPGNKVVGFYMPEYKDYSKIVIIRYDSGEYIIGIPRIGKQLLAPRMLVNSGWSVRRLAWIIVAKKSQIPASELSITRAYKNQFRAMIIDKLPASPVFFTRTTSGSIYGVIQKRHLIAHIQTQDSSFKAFSSVTHQSFVSSNDLFISIQSAILHKIGQKSHDNINNVILRGLEFRKTQPDILSSIPDDSTVSVYHKGDDMAMGINGSSKQLIDGLLKLIAREQGARHLHKKAFALPDQTVGYEYVPTSPDIKIRNTDDDACGVISGFDDLLFACVDGDTVTISHKKDVAEYVLRKIKDKQYVISGEASGDIMQTLFPGLSVRSISFFGTQNSVDVDVLLNE